MFGVERDAGGADRGRMRCDNFNDEWAGGGWRAVLVGQRLAAPASLSCTMDGGFRVCINSVGGVECLTLKTAVEVEDGFAAETRVGVRGGASGQQQAVSSKQLINSRGKVQSFFLSDSRPIQAFTGCQRCVVYL